MLEHLTATPANPWDLEENGLNRKDQTNLRFYVAMIVAPKIAATQLVKPARVASLPVEKIAEKELAAALNEAKAAYFELGASDQVAKGRNSPRS